MALIVQTVPVDFVVADILFLIHESADLAVTRGPLYFLANCFLILNTANREPFMLTVDVAGYI